MLVIFFRMLSLCIALASAPTPLYSKLSNTIAHSAPNTVSQFSPIPKMNPKVYQLAMKAHKKAKAMGVATKPVLTVIDYSLPSTQPRMWVIDTTSNRVMYHTHVAHGSGSGDNTPRRFSDKPGSNQTSLGVFVTGSTYQGKHGTTLTLHGLEKGVNGNALKRRIVIHSANYVSDHMIKTRGRLGRSWGCPALNTKVAQPIIQTIKGGSMVFAYYPDDTWLNRSSFLS